jgi:hypothetical protein
MKKMQIHKPSVQKYQLQISHQNQRKTTNRFSENNGILS